MKNRFALPPRAIALSLCALFLMTGFAGIMAVTDEYASVDMENPIAYDETECFGVVRVGTSSADVQVALNINTIALLPSENGGFFLADVTQSTVTAPDRVILNILYSVRSPITSGDVTRIVVFNDSVTSMYMRCFLASGNYNLHFIEESPGEWVLNLSPSDRLKLKGTPSDLIRLNMIYGASNFPSNGIIEFSYEMYGDDVPLYYASTLALVFGIVMILCSIFALGVRPHKVIIKKIRGRKKNKGGRK